MNAPAPARTVDLRSDTVTRPTPAMRRAMAEAEVGDDVYGEDPTVARLEAAVAEMTGKEAGLFVPTGTMGNQIALAAHTRRGVEVIAPVGAHIYEYELGSMANLAGLMPRLVPAPGGVPDPADVRAAVSPGRHQAPTGLIVLENTHNKAGGTVVPLDVARAVADVAREAGVPLHLDGARAWNAAVALGVPLAEVCAPFDSASLCLSKGLAAPVGSVLVGSKAFLAEAHRYRKMYGGGMRQVGVLAAAGLIAVRDMVGRLADDHRRARWLAEALQGIDGVDVDLATVQTNMVYLSVADARGFVPLLEREGLRCNAMGATAIRLVTHADVDDDDVAFAAEAVRRAAADRLGAAARRGAADRGTASA
jgi:threonine aldolase